MGKISIQDLASNLANRQGIDKTSAETFIKAMFTTIENGLNADGMVKIKGFGTFKVIDVDARESVSVNTGERVTIEGHKKITFTPDNTMKEMVNRPFAQFDTITLDDELSLIDIVPTPATDEESEKADEATQLPQEEENPSDSERQIIDKGEESSESEEETVDTKIVDTKEEEEEGEEDDNDEEEDEEIGEEEEEEEHKHNGWWWIVLIIIVIAGILYASYHVGYNFGQYIDIVEDFLNIKGADSTDVRDEEADIMKILNYAQDSTKTDSIEKDSSQVIESRNDSTMTTDTIATADNKSSDEPIDYGALDNRVRTGAYTITGLDYEVTVKEGETVQKISRRIFGPGMECYIEVFNGLERGASVQAGQKLKIPKLKLKKKK